jgi:hypothetical protein
VPESAKTNSSREPRIVKEAANLVVIEIEIFSA